MKTPRTRLSPISITDFSDLLDMFGEPNIFKYIKHLQGNTLEEFKLFLELKLSQVQSRTGYYWVMRKLSNNELIGAINLTPIPKTKKLQIGWLVRNKFQKQGFAFEGAESAINFARTNTDIDPVHAVYEEENIASRKILDRLGFEYDGHVEDEDLILVNRVLFFN